MTTREAAIATNRFGLGARPGELADAASDPRGWLLRQLRGAHPAPPELAGLAPAAEVLAGFQAGRAERRARRQAAGAAAGPATAPPDPGAAAPGPDPVAALVAGLRSRVLPHYLAAAAARTRVAISTREPFRERLVHFWSNHFAVSVDKPVCLGTAGALENEAIRPHLDGRFVDLLVAAEQHPAMITYLDNTFSVGPDSRLAQRAAGRGPQDRRLDINENLAREILELHTLGVEGGYTQDDVTSFARVLTGWSIGGGQGRLAGGTPGAFLFREGLHEPGARTVLGRRYAQDGLDQGEAVLHDLARHPATARHVATKLVRHFVADEPPPRAVEAVARAFRDSDGHLPTVHAALVKLDEPWAADAPRKFKTPQDFVFSAGRGLGLEPAQAQAPRAPVAPLELLGQRPWSPGSPAGWPDRAADWDGADALMKRIEWSVALADRVGDSHAAIAAAEQMLGDGLTAATRRGLQRAASGSQALVLLLMSPEFQRR
jgi:uncharacterized protein (DUF1800 family)